MKYLNRFSIEEDDQDEIHVKDYLDKHVENMSERDYYNAAKEVMLKAQQGSGHHSGLTPKLRTLRTLWYGGPLNLGEGNNIWNTYYTQLKTALS